MSYLLDALKNAEHERKQGEQSELPLYTEPEIKAALPVWLIAVIVTLLALTFFKLFFDGTETGEAVSVDDSEMISERVEYSQIKSSAQSDLGESNSTGIETSATVSDQLEGSVAPKDVAPKDVVPKNVVPKNVVPKELAELDRGTLSLIPSLSLESHIYSPAADYRSVIINGQSYGEGSLLSADVALFEITQTGVVLKVGEQYVVLPKGISWVSTKHAK